MRRLLWNIAGLTFVAIGVVGAFLPILPTVVFMLVAAYCFARGSERLHGWLMNSLHVSIDTPDLSVVAMEIIPTQSG